MDAWWQCEVPYPFVPQDVINATDSVRASLPNRYCDPKIAADLFEEVIDEFLLCDDLGLNVLAVEHHAGINSLLGANPLLVGILARQTRQVRLLSLGTLISLRKDPVRVAEEYATADVISRGRLEIGFVKSGGTEMASNNANPVNNIERYWEAIDLIKKALSHHDGPFSWEGKHFTHRHVNIWPRPWQQPHPRMWSATGDPETAAEVGRRGMVHVLVLRGPDGTKRAYAAHRKAPYADTSPAELLPTGAKVVMVHGVYDPVMPPYTGRDYVAKLRRAAILAGQRAAACRAADLSHGAQERKLRRDVGGAERRAAHVARRRAGDGAGYPVRGQSRQRLQTGHEFLRPGRRLRSPEPGRPLGVHDPPRVGEEHPSVLEGSPPASSRDQARHGRLTSACVSVP